MYKNTVKTRIVIFCVLWILALGAPFALWLHHTGNPFSYIRDGSPPGQIWYVFSKLFGLLAAFCLLLHLVLMTGKRHWHGWWTVSAHQKLGLIVLILATCHAAFFVAAKSIRGGKFSYETLIPSFSHGHYKSMVSLGVITFFLLCITVVTGYFRKARPNQKSFTLSHKIGLVCAALLILHFLSIGSEI